MLKTQKAIADKTINDIEKQLVKYYGKAMKNVIYDFEVTYDKLLATIESGNEPTPADLYKLDRYWKMQAQLKKELEKLGNKQIVLLSKEFEKEWNEIYKATVLPSDKAFSTISTNNAKSMINNVWLADGKNFSQRVWDNTERLSQTLNDELINCVVTGKKTTELSKKLQRRFEVSAYRANTLVRTEVAHIQTQASVQRYKDYGLTKYIFLADTDEKMDRYIRTIYTKACDMDNLINELTFYAKVDSDKINYNFIKLNLTEYFNDCIDEIGVDLESRNIELKYINELDKETAIVADPEQFKRVINNIINNSMKYMEINNGVVEVHLYNEGDDVHIDISDNGKGISQKDIGHIFDRFYRSDTSRNSRTGGSGIGLSIVKKIIIDHGGSITAESIPYEKTTIKIILDRYKEDKDEQNTDSRG